MTDTTMKRATPNNNNAARNHEGGGGGDDRPPKAKKPRRPRNRNKNKKNTNTTTTTQVRDASSWPLNQSALDALSNTRDWEKITGLPVQPPMASYRKDGVRLNFWLSTGTVGSYLEHPQQGKTQLFRRTISMAEAADLFDNPRRHTGKGYKTTAEQAVRMEVDQPPPVPMTTDPERSATDTAPKCRQQFSETTFASLTMIRSKSKRALTEILHYESMTKVQEATLPAILAGKDVVAKAKTGSGKTTAFLLPIIENLAWTSTRNVHHNKVYAVILSPTRELANQISAEFGKLATFHPNMKHQLVTMIGGTNIGKDKARLKPNTVRVIVATPGRLQDHLGQNTANIVDRLSEVHILCLDEADRLLDMGFKHEIEKIMAYMPKQHLRSNGTSIPGGIRQTLLFSATFDGSIQNIAKIAMRPQYEIIDTLDPDEDNTNVQVIQKSLVVPMQYHLLALEHILRGHIQDRTAQQQRYKIIVFFTTARVAGYMAELFRADQERYPQYTDANLFEMHSRKSQGYRTKVAKQFTATQNTIMFSSDVSARGVDYPDVTAVVQVGAPSDKAQYIHRLGRTARAGNSGVGIILLNDFEQTFLRELSEFDVQPVTTLSVSDEDAIQEQQHIRRLYKEGGGLNNSAKYAYQAFLGYYNSNTKRLKIHGGKAELVRIANDYSVVLGFPAGKPPPLQAKTVGKMGLKGVSGIVIEKGDGGYSRGGGGGGRGRNNNNRGGRGGRGR